MLNGNILIKNGGGHGRDTYGFWENCKREMPRKVTAMFIASMKY